MRKSVFVEHPKWVDPDEALRPLLYAHQLRGVGRVRWESLPLLVCCFGLFVVFWFLSWLGCFCSSDSPRAMADAVAAQATEEAGANPVCGAGPWIGGKRRRGGGRCGAHLPPSGRG